MSAIHIRRFDGGRSTPQEFHLRHGFPPGARCAGCGGPPAVRCMVLAPLDEASCRGMIPGGVLLGPELSKVLVELHENGRDGPSKVYVRVSATYACTACAPSQERAAAKAPSWCVVEFSRGPNPTHRVQAAVS